MPKIGAKVTMDVTFPSVNAKPKTQDAMEMKPKIQTCMECAEEEEVLYKKNAFGRGSETKMKDVRQATQFAENKEGQKESTARRKYPARDSFGFSFDETGSIENFEDSNKDFLFAETDQDLLDQTTPRRMVSLGRSMSRLLGAFDSFGADSEKVFVADLGNGNVDEDHVREDTNQDFCNKDMNGNSGSKPRQGWRANRRESIMNMVISFKPKSTNKASKGDDSSERNPIPTEQRRCQEKEGVQNEPQPSQEPQRRFNRRGSLVDMINSMSFKTSSARKTSMGDVSQKHPTSLNRQHQSESRRGSKYHPRAKPADNKLAQEQPNLLHAKQATCKDDERAGNDIQPSNATKGRAARRGSFMDMIDAILFAATGDNATGEDQDSNQEHPNPLNNQHQSGSRRRNTYHQPREDEVRHQEHPHPLNSQQQSGSRRRHTYQPQRKPTNTNSRVNMFDKVAAGRFSRRGSFLTNGTASTASTLGSDLKHGSEPRNERNKPKPRVKDAKTNLGADVNYNEKISSILYAK
mmetsp:Transcript_5879/g.12759  ORF Transcript_5879/g.12759 Transcript_5879/m.12759 type:complete len:521 (-) Transcript_5879:103-1665(-)